MKTYGVLVLACVAAAGCATGQSATYQHPATHDVEVCQRDRVNIVPGWGILGLLTSPAVAYDVVHANNVYAECKSNLEAKGYERWGR